MSTPLITVVICTYNRHDLLQIAARSICEQTLNPEHFELLIVDNNSKDSTREVAAQFCARYPNVRYVMEPTQGLAHARNRGLKEARGEYVGYIDDDCKVPPGWLSVAHEIISERHPDIFGGPFFAFYLTPKPRWYKDQYGSYELTKDARQLGAGEFVFGGNMFFLRALLESVGGFGTDFGMVGHAIDYGEEIIPQQAIRASNPQVQVFFEPRLYLYHLVRPEKMNIRRMWRENFARGKAGFRMFAATPQEKSSTARYWLDMLRWSVRIAVDAARGLVFRDRDLYPHVQNYWYEHTGKHVSVLGRIVARRNQAAAASSASSNKPS